MMRARCPKEKTPVAEGVSSVDAGDRAKPDTFRTELTAIGEQYVIPGCEIAPVKGQQGSLW